MTCITYLYLHTDMNTLQDIFMFIWARGKLWGICESCLCQHSHIILMTATPLTVVAPMVLARFFQFHWSLQTNLGSKNRCTFISVEASIRLRVFKPHQCINSTPSTPWCECEDQLVHLNMNHHTQQVRHDSTCENPVSTPFHSAAGVHVLASCCNRLHSHSTGQD